MSQSARGDIYPEFPRVGVRAANLLNARRSEEDEPPYGSRVFGMKSFADSLFVCSSGLFDGTENERSLIDHSREICAFGLPIDSHFMSDRNQESPMKSYLNLSTEVATVQGIHPSASISVVSFRVSF